MAAKGSIPDEVKRHMVVALACYDAPSAVAESVKEEFGLTLTRQAVQGYDPTKHAGTNLARKWKEMFYAEREAFKKATGDIPIAQRAFRLRMLNRMATKAEGMKNLALAAELLEQAAKEIGEAFTNKVKVDANVKTSAQVVVVPAKEAA